MMTAGKTAEFDRQRLCDELEAAPCASFLSASFGKMFSSLCSCFSMTALAASTCAEAPGLSAPEADSPDSLTGALKM
jgi:hypothetical protein